MPGERVLVVDDNPTNLKLARILLASDGYEVRTAGDADETLAMLADFHPRLILMDLQLPGRDGLALTRELRTDRAYDDVLIVAYTAYAMKGDEEKAMAAGCGGYLTKPMDADAFLGAIARFIR